MDLTNETLGMKKVVVDTSLLNKIAMGLRYHDREQRDIGLAIKFEIIFGYG